MTELVVMLALGAVCWVFRIVFVLLVPASALPARVRRGLDHLAPAVLAGIAAVELTSTVGHGDLRSGLLALAAMGAGRRDRASVPEPEPDGGGRARRRPVIDLLIR